MAGAERPDLCMPWALEVGRGEPGWDPSPRLVPLPHSPAAFVWVGAQCWREVGSRGWHPLLCAAKFQAHCALGRT